MPDTTELVISGIDIAPYSARGLTQTLEPIRQSQQLRRTVNGVLIDLADPLFKKYRTKISGKDMQPPAFNDRWPGLLVQISCAAELGYLTIGGTPGRTVVPGSSRVDGLFTFYRPQLVMRIVSFDMAQAEWNAETAWALEAEEV